MPLEISQKGKIEYAHGNGVHIITTIEEPSERKKTTGFEVHISAGGAYYDTRSGESHFTEHTMVSATRAYSTQDLGRILNGIAAYRNAYTGIRGMTTEISGHIDDAVLMWQLIREMTFDPQIPDNIVEQERRIILAEIAREQTPSKLLNVFIREQLFPEGNIGRLTSFDVLGAPLSVMGIQQEHLRLRHQGMISQSEILFVISNPGIVRDEILGFADSLSQTRAPVPPILFHNGPPYSYYDFRYLPIVHEFAPPHVDAKLLVPCPVTTQNAAIRILFQRIALVGRVARFSRHARDELGLVYDLGCGFDIATQSLEIDATVTQENLGRLVALFLETIADPELLQEYESEDRFDDFKRAFLKRDELESESSPLADLNFTVNALRNKGIFVTIEDFRNAVRSVTIDDLRRFQYELQTGLSQMRVIGISSDKSLTQTMQQLPK